jgi:NAD(P)-dependent dehydrogenase (short-subunit alcohol dehydrogenase family)
MMDKQVALITGGTRGIGFGIACELAKSGFALAVNGVRDTSEVTEALSHLKTLGADVIYCRGDVSSAASRQSMLDNIKKNFGKLHVLVNNAGVAPKERKDILDASEESFERLIHTNLQGPYFLTQSVANWMIDQRKKDDEYKACIINITSISATEASVNRGEYCISKAGLSMATKLFAFRLGEFNIPVYEVRPGVVKTDMTAGVIAKYDQMIEEGMTIQKRWGTPEEVGKAVAALVQGYFPYSTGQVIMVDGGLTIPRL